jgi:hypothetical protein
MSAVRGSRRAWGAVAISSSLTVLLFFFEFLALKVSLSVLGRTPECRRAIDVQYGNLKLPHCSF